MSPDSEPRRREPFAAAELEAEREVDFSGYARALLDRWWLLLLGAVLGALAGFLLARTDSSTYQAQAIVYLGQPTSPLSGTTFPTIASDPTGVAAVARSQAVIDKVAAEVGLPPRQLRRNVSSSILGERNRQQTSVALVGVTVRGENAGKVERAANLIAEEVVASSSGYAAAKIETLEQRIDAQQQQLASVESRIEDVSDEIQGNASLTSVERLTLTNLLALLEQERARLSDQALLTEQLLQAAEKVESGQVVTPASSAKVDARSTRTSIVVGAFLGLLLGALVALLWAPVARLRPA